MRGRLWAELATLTLAAMLIVLLPLLGACGAEPVKESPVETAAKKEPVKEAPAAIKLGYLFTSAGPGAPLAASGKGAAIMTAELVNQRGGIQGHPLELITEDDLGKPEGAVAAASRLIYRDRVLGILGPISSANSLASAPVSEEAGVTQVGVGIAAGITEPIRKHIFRATLLESANAEAVIKAFKALGVTKVAFMQDTQAYGVSGFERFSEMAPKEGIQIVIHEKFGPDDKDMTPQLTRIKNANPDAVALWAQHAAGALILKQRNTLGIKVPFVAQYGMCNIEVWRIAGADNINDFYFAAHPTVLPAGDLDPTNRQHATILEFRKHYDAKYAKEPDTWASYGWDLVMLFSNALERAIPRFTGDLAHDRTAVRDEYERITDFAGTRGTYSYSPTDHDGLTGGHSLGKFLADGTIVYARELQQ